MPPDNKILPHTHQYHSRGGALKRVGAHRTIERKTWQDGVYRSRERVCVFGYYVLLYTGYYFCEKQTSRVLNLLFMSYCLLQSVVSETLFI